jgi:hypothetical protein
VGGSEQRHEITTAAASRRPLPGADQHLPFVSDPNDGQRFLVRVFGGGAGWWSGWMKRHG